VVLIEGGRLSASELIERFYCGEIEVPKSHNPKIIADAVMLSYSGKGTARSGLNGITDRGEERDARMIGLRYVPLHISHLEGVLTSEGRVREGGVLEEIRRNQDVLQLNYLIVDTASKDTLRMIYLVAKPSEDTRQPIMSIPMGLSSFSFVPVPDGRMSIMDLLNTFYDIKVGHYYDNIPLTADGVLLPQEVDAR
jgi:hypothetical protein